MDQTALRKTGMKIRNFALLLTCGALIATTMAVDANAAPARRLDSEYAAIGYENTATANPVVRLFDRIKSGKAKLEYKGKHGYLESLLKALNINPVSQILVYSKTSLQYAHITAKTPRAIYFNDDTYVGWVQGTNIVEIATTDDKLGTVFYTLDNEPNPDRLYERQTSRCIACHDTYGNMGGGVPELLVRSTIVNVNGEKLRESYVLGNTSDDTPFRVRWGGWYVTGQSGNQTHLGNILLKSGQDASDLDSVRHGNIDSLDQLNFLDTKPYLEKTSDIVALMTLEHQLTVHNQITYVKFKAPVVLARMGHADAAKATSWAALPADSQHVLTHMLDKLVQRMLFVDALTFTDKISGSPAFEAWFEAQGPRDSQGRSLRDFDLKTRLFKHRLSFLVYSEGFDTLPPYAKDYVYQQFAKILEGRDHSDTYAYLSDKDRRETLEILTATKPDFRRYVSTRNSSAKP